MNGVLWVGLCRNLLYTVYMMEQWETHKDSPGEETLVEYDEGKEFDTKTLRNDLPDLEERIKRLEFEGWRIFKRGSDFVVMERIQKDTRKEASH